MTAPPEAAGPFNVTVPVDEVPPMTVEGESVSVESEAALIVNVAVTDAPLSVAVIVAFVVAATGDVVTLNVAVVAPAATVTEIGVTALGLLEFKLIVVPAEGAGPFSVTVPVDGVPPITEDGERVTLTKLGARIVSVAVWLVPLSEAEIVAAVVAATGVVVIVNVVELAPAGIVTVDDVLALVLLEVTVTVSPPAGAGPFRVKVPVEDVPPITEAGLTVTPVRVAGLMVRVAVTDVPFRVAVIVADVDVATAVVVIVAVAEVAPAGTTMVAGGVALPLLEVNVMVSPPAGAGPFKVTVAVDDVPPITEVGLTVIEVITAGVTVSVVVTAVPFS